MYFDSWTTFLVMEGHGLYVWSAYAVAMLVIIYNLAAPLVAKRRIITRIKQQERLAKKTRHKSSGNNNSAESVPFGSMQRGAQ